VNDFMHHRISNLSGLLGKDRTPWGTPRPGLRSGSFSYPGSHPAETPYGMNISADPESVPPRPAVCECADVRAWLGPRRAGRRTLR
jgi:hypothetical protein